MLDNYGVVRHTTGELANISLKFSAYDGNALQWVLLGGQFNGRLIWPIRSGQDAGGTAG